ERSVAGGPAVLDVVAVSDVVTVRAERVGGSGRDEEHCGGCGWHGGPAEDPAFHLLSFLPSVHSNCVTPAAAERIGMAVTSGIRPDHRQGWVALRSGRGAADTLPAERSRSRPGSCGHSLGVVANGPAISPGFGVSTAVASEGSSTTTPGSFAVRKGASRMSPLHGRRRGWRLAIAAAAAVAAAGTLSPVASSATPVAPTPDANPTACANRVN